MDSLRLKPASGKFGYSAALDAELTRIGSLSIEEFARRYSCSAGGDPSSIPWDPTTARYWDIFHSDPLELLRQRIAQNLEALLPKGTEPCLPETTFTTLFLLWDYFQSACNAEEASAMRLKSSTLSDEEREAGLLELKRLEPETEQAWKALEAHIKSKPLLEIVAWWHAWDRSRFTTLRDLYFETGFHLLAWLEADEAALIQQVNEQKTNYQERKARYPAWNDSLSAFDADAALAQERQRRLHWLHQFLIGHYGIY